MTTSGTGRSTAATRSRPIALGPFRVEFSSPIASLVTRWDALYAGFPDAALGLPLLQVETSSASGGTLRTTVDGGVLLTDPNWADHELAITRVINHRKLDSEPNLVHLHAASVARGGRAVVLAGRSGDGKSTLTAKLMQAGWEYVTDEQVTLDELDRNVIPYPRPLTLRQGVWDLFEGLGGERTTNDYHRVETTLAELGATAAQHPAEPVLLLAPQYRALEEDGLLEFRTRAEVVEFLVSCCHDVERIGHRTCAALVGLASRCAAKRLHFSNVDRAVEMVGTAFAVTLHHQPVPYRVLPEPDTTPTGHGWVLAPGSRAWVFADGSGVAYSVPEQQLVLLDAVGAALWEILVAPTAASLLLADSPDAPTALAVERWLETLVSLGLVQRT